MPKTKGKRCAHCRRRRYLLGELCRACNAEAVAIKTRWERICRIDKKVNQVPRTLARTFRVATGTLSRSEDG